jgi:hypothetical protein
LIVKGPQGGNRLQGTEGDSHAKAQQRQQDIADEVRSIRNALRKIAASLRPWSDAHQHAAAEKKITELEERIVSLEALKQRGISSLSSASEDCKAGVRGLHPGAP